MARQNKVAKSVVASVLSDEGNDKRSKFAAIKAFFVLYRLKFVRYRNDLFSRLRNKTWKISEDEYNKSFEEEGALEPKGDMGYSGSVSTRFAIDEMIFSKACLLDILHNQGWTLLGEVCSPSF